MDANPSHVPAGAHFSSPRYQAGFSLRFNLGLNDSEAEPNLPCVSSGSMPVPHLGWLVYLLRLGCAPELAEFLYFPVSSMLTALLPQ
jgi:hypothetical protein